MKLQESLAKASRESGSGLGNTALSAGQLSGEAREEVILGLLRGEDAHGRQHAKGVSAEEDNVLGIGTGTLAVNLLHNLLDVVDRIADAGVLGHALVGEVNLAVLGYGHVLQQCIAADGVVDIRLTLLVKVDNLGIAAALQVEDALIVPSVLVIADKQTLGVGGEGCLASAAEAEEDGSVLALHVGVGGTVHRGNALQWQVVVLHGEHTLLHLAAIPCVDNHLLTAGGVEGYASFAVEAELLVVLHLSLRGIVDNKVGLKALKLLLGGLDKHILHKVSLPCHLYNEANGQAGSLVGTAVGIHHVELLVTELLDGNVLNLAPNLFAHGVVVVLIFLGGPPNLVVALCIVNDILVFR